MVSWSETVREESRTAAQLWLQRVGGNVLQPQHGMIVHQTERGTARVIGQTTVVLDVRVRVVSLACARATRHSLSRYMKEGTAAQLHVQTGRAGRRRCPAHEAWGAVEQGGVVKADLVPKHLHSDTAAGRPSSTH